MEAQPNGAAPAPASKYKTMSPPRHTRTTTISTIGVDTVIKAVVMAAQLARADAAMIAVRRAPCWSALAALVAGGVV